VALSVGALTALAALLSLLALGRESFWLDEAYSVFVARLPAGDFWGLITTSQANSALYYLLLRGWISLGEGEAVVRLLSVVFAVASVPLCYAVGRRLFGATVGLAAAGLLALNSFVIQFAQEARGYSLALFLVVLGSYLFIRAVEEGGWWRWTGYVVVSGLAPYAHFFAGLVVLAQVASIPFLDRRPSHRTLVGVYGVVTVMVTPLLAFVLLTSGNQIGWIPPLSAGRITAALAQVAGARIVPAAVLLVALFGLAWLSALRAFSRESGSAGRSQRTWAWALSIGWFLVPVVGAVAVSVVKPVLVDKYLIVAIPGLVLTAAAGIAAWRHKVAWVILALLLVISASQVALLHVRRDKDDWRSATRYVLERSRQGDGIVFYRPLGRRPFGHYVGRIVMNGGSVTVPSAVLEVFDWDGLDLEPGPRDHNYEAIARAARSFDRVWVVVNPVVTEHQQGLSDALEGSFTRDQRAQFTGIVVYLYVAS
jgi:mannosyltransferase